MHRKVKASYSNKAANALLDRCFLIWKLHDHPCAFLQTCLEDFAKDFAYSLSQHGLGADKIQGEKQKIFVKAICYAMAHGAHSDMTSIGGWAIVNRKTFSAVLEAIPAQSIELGFNTQDLLRDILNKCLVQRSTPRGTYTGWHNNSVSNGSDFRDPSLHIQQILKEYPDLPRVVDNDGRITLHYAAHSRNGSSLGQRAPQETIECILKAYPDGASVIDPKTGLYPFMLAAGGNAQNISTDASASSGNISASLSLLLANPSLVACGAPDDVANDSSKRKRSVS